MDKQLLNTNAKLYDTGAFDLEAKNISSADENGNWLFENASLTIGPGESISLCGPTGSGKTLLLRALALLDPISKGEIKWIGKSISDAIPEYRKKVIYQHQQPAIFPGTVEENLQIPFNLKSHKNINFNVDYVKSLLKKIGCNSSFLSKKHSGLSGGEKQLVCLIRSIQLNPCILLLDEPTAALDPGSTRAVEALICQWQEDQKRSYLWVTHDNEQAKRISKRFLTMQSGKLSEDS